MLQVLCANEALGTSGQCIASFVPPAALLGSPLYKYISERNAALAAREVKVDLPQAPRI